MLFLLEASEWWARHIESKLQAPPLAGDTADHDTTREGLAWDEWESFLLYVRVRIWPKR